VMIQSLLKDRFGRDFGHAGLMNFNGTGEVSGQPSDDGRTRLETLVRTIIKKAPAATWVGTVTTAGHPRQTMRQALHRKSTDSELGIAFCPIREHPRLSNVTALDTNIATGKRTLCIRIKRHAHLFPRNHLGDLTKILIHTNQSVVEHVM
jgi:hypothetical protein